MVSSYIPFFLLYTFTLKAAILMTGGLKPGTQYGKEGTVLFFVRHILWGPFVFKLFDKGILY